MMCMLFAGYVAVLITLGAGPANISHQQFQVPDRQPAEASQSSPTNDQNQDSSKLTKDKETALIKKIFERRRIFIKSILGEITAKVMPEATGYVNGEGEIGFEVKEGTHEGVDKILSSYMADPNPEVRAAAYHCLQWYMEKLPQLKKHIWVGAMDPDDQVAISATHILARVKLSAEDAPNLIYLLQHGNPKTYSFVLRKMQYWGLGEQSGPGWDKAQLLPAVPRLFELLDCDVFLVPSRAAEVLRHLGPIISNWLGHTIELLNQGNTEQEKLATVVLRGMGPLAISALPQLISRLEANPTLRKNGYYFQYKVAQAILDIEPELVDMVALKMAKNMGEQSEKGYLELEVLMELGSKASTAIPLLKSFQVEPVNNLYLNATKALAFVAPDDPEVIMELRKRLIAAEDKDKFWYIDGLGRATTNFDLARPGLELVVSGHNEENKERAQEILDRHSR